MVRHVVIKPCCLKKKVGLCWVLSLFHCSHNWRECCWRNSASNIHCTAEKPYVPLHQWHLLWSPQCDVWDHSNQIFIVWISSWQCVTIIISSYDDRCILIWWSSHHHEADTHTFYIIAKRRGFKVIKYNILVSHSCLWWLFDIQNYSGLCSSYFQTSYLCFALLYIVKSLWS